MKKLIINLLVIALIPSCQKSPDYQRYENMDVTSEFILDNSLIIEEGDCAGDINTETYLCFESVLNDSRCPEGVECFWEGNAKVQFRFKNPDNDPVFFNLNTHKGFTTDTIVGGYKFTLISLQPYPSLKTMVMPKDYKAEVEIEKVNNR